MVLLSRFSEYLKNVLYGLLINVKINECKERWIDGIKNLTFYILTLYI